MAYENDSYRAFKSKLSTMEMAKGFVDLARSLRSLKYADQINIGGQGRIHDRPVEVSIKQSVKDEILEFGAMKCEDLVVKLFADIDPGFDIRKACKE